MNQAIACIPIRPGELNQLEAARQKALSSRGKGAALMATLALLAAKGVATLQRTPSKVEKRGEWDMRIEGSVGCMVRAGWIPGKGGRDGWGRRG